MRETCWKAAHRGDNRINVTAMRCRDVIDGRGGERMGNEKMRLNKQVDDADDDDTSNGTNGINTCNDAS